MSVTYSKRNGWTATAPSGFLFRSIINRPYRRSTGFVSREAALAWLRDARLTKAVR